VIYPLRTIKGAFFKCDVQTFCYKKLRFFENNGMSTRTREETVRTFFRQGERESILAILCGRLLITALSRWFIAITKVGHSWASLFSFAISLRATNFKNKV